MQLDGANLEAVDGVGVTNVVLHQACLVSRDCAGIRNQLDPPSS